MANIKELLGAKAKAVTTNSYIVVNNNKRNGKRFKSKRVVRFERKKYATEKFANSILNYCLGYKLKYTA
jgi:ribosome-associated protein YbcJ (S4-like RNA binding protein)